MSAAGEISDALPAQTSKDTQSRLRIDKGTIENAKAAAKTAVEVLAVVAEATENVPYLGAISKALSAFKEVLDEVDVCKEDCRAAIREAREFVDLIQEFEMGLVQSNDGKVIELHKVFVELGDVIVKCLDTLQALRVDSTRRRDRFRLLFKRDDVQLSVAECRDKMRVAKEKLNLRMAFSTNSMVRDLHHRTQPHDISQNDVCSDKLVWRLRAANSIFYGREPEVDSAVNLIVNKAPARVAILGPGGIGKTSIALGVLHDPQVIELYGEQRCFMSCEGTTTADAVVRALADALSFIWAAVTSPLSARHNLLGRLKTTRGILCLDNLETPLDADKPAVEELLNEIAALPSVALLITSRDTSIPTIKWTSPALPHVRPFSQEAALSTWDDICDRHDEYALKLIEAVDRMPLAVTLLARLASVEGNTKKLWTRWETEHVDLIRTGGEEHRLLSVGASIELSLRALRGREETISVLSIICILSDGLYEENLSMLDAALKDRLPFSRAITILRQFSLIYTEDFGDTLHPLTNALSPIRHHIREHYVSDELCLMLAPIIQDKWFGDTDSFIVYCMNRQGICREHCLEMVISQPWLTDSIEVLYHALEKARVLKLPTHTSLIRSLASQMSFVRRDHKNARAILTEAFEADERSGNRAGMVDDWTTWLNIFGHEFEGREGKCEFLDEVQEAIQKAWSCNENQAWAKIHWHYKILAKAQHSVNDGRRKLEKPVVHRSGLYWDDSSTDDLHPVHIWDHDEVEAQECYDHLTKMSSPPWDLSLLLETHRALGHAHLEGQDRRRA